MSQTLRAFMSTRGAAALVLTGVLLVYGALYAQTRQFAFVWTDRAAVVDSETFRRPLAEQLRTTDHTRLDPNLARLEGVALMHDSYRPLVLLSHNVDIRLFGDRPGPMHVHSVLLGALAILGAFWLAWRTLGSASQGLLVAAIFAFHPLQAEAICFVSARADPLSGVLGLAAAGLVAEGAARGGRAKTGAMIGAGVLTFLSLCAKEAVALLPVGVACLALARGRRREWAGGILAMLAAVPVYVVLRALLARGAAVQTRTVLDAITHVPAACVEYAVTFFFPLDISIARPLYVTRAVGWLVLGGLVVLVVVLLRRPPAQWKARFGLAAAGAGWVGLLLAPSTVAVLSERAVADRYAYLSVFGFALTTVVLGTWLADRRPGLRRVMQGAAGVFLAICVVITASEIPAWKSHQALVEHAIQVEPLRSANHRRLGHMLAAQGQWPAAVESFEKAAALADATDRELNDLGVGYMNVGRVPDAERMVRRAIERSGGLNFQAWYNLGTTRRLQGDPRGACESYRRALLLSPNYRRASADHAAHCAGYAP